MVFVLSCLERY